MSFLLKYKGLEEKVELSPDATVADLQQTAALLFNLEPSTCKLVGLKLPKKAAPKRPSASSADDPATDSVRIADIPGLKFPQKLLVVGTQRETIDAFMAAELAAPPPPPGDIVMYEPPPVVESEAHEDSKMEVSRPDSSASFGGFPSPTTMMNRFMESSGFDAASLGSFGQRRSIHSERDFVATPDPSEGPLGDLKTTLQYSIDPKLSEFQVDLTTSMLEEVLRLGISMPFILSIQKTRDDSSEKFYASVREYSSPGGISMSPLLAEKLGLVPFDFVYIESINPPKASFATFQAMGSDWHDISIEERTALLEFELRKTIFIFESQMLNITYRGLQLQLKVVELKPEKIGFTIDTELSTEILDPSDPKPTVLEAASAEPVSVTLEEGQSLFFAKYEVKDVNEIVNVSCRATTGDCALYGSFDVTKPSPSDFDWCSQDSLQSAEFEVSNSDMQFRVGTLYISIFALSHPLSAEFKVVSRSRLADSGKATGFEGDAKEGKTCDNCGRIISVENYMMHEARCLRTNWKCRSCFKVIPKAAKSKHESLAHRILSCECGKTFEQRELVVHKRQECSLRIVTCIYCPLKLQDVKRGEHQAECGNRKCMCKLCSVLLSRKELKRHMSREHGVDPESITYSDYL